MVANPYKGLRAFEEADAADFFGREALTRQLVERLGETRFLAVVGPSGSGKSSVVRAGLLPALRRGALPGSERWFIAEMFPGRASAGGARGGAAAGGGRPAGAACWSSSSATSTGLPARGRAVAARATTPSWSWSIDQFEEVFTLVEDEATRTHFLESLRPR